MVLPRVTVGLCAVSLLFVMGSAQAAAQSVVSIVHDSVVDERALNLGDPRFGAVGYAGRINGNGFQQDAVVSHKGHQYVAYYDANRRVCIARRKLPTGLWQIIRFDDYVFDNNNAHCSISLGICPGGGTIHLAFDQHNEMLNYRVSRRGVANTADDVHWHADLFGPIRSYLEKGRAIRITYRAFGKRRGGGLQFAYRQGSSGNGQRMLVDYDSRNGVWQHTRQIDSAEGTYGASASRSGYANGYTYGPRGVFYIRPGSGAKIRSRRIMI